MARVQKSSVVATGFADTADVVLTGVVAGHLLVLIVATNGAGVLLGHVTDSAGDTWTRGAAITGDWGELSIWYTENCSSGTHTITVDPSGGGDLIAAVAVEHDSIVTSSSVDGTPLTQTQTGVTSISTPSLTTTNASDLIIAAVAPQDGFVGVTLTEGGGFTLIDKFESGFGSGANFSATEQYVGSTGSYTATWTQDSSSNPTTAIIAFKVAGGGGGTTYNVSTSLGAAAGTTAVAGLVISASTSVAAATTASPQRTKVLTGSVSVGILQTLIDSYIRQISMNASLGVTAGLTDTRTLLFNLSTALGASMAIAATRTKVFTNSTTLAAAVGVTDNYVKNIAVTAALAVNTTVSSSRLNAFNLSTSLAVAGSVLPLTNLAMLNAISLGVQAVVSPTLLNTLLSSTTLGANAGLLASFPLGSTWNVAVSLLATGSLTPALNLSIQGLVGLPMSGAFAPTLSAIWVNALALNAGVTLSPVTSVIMALSETLGALVSVNTSQGGASYTNTVGLTTAVSATAMPQIIQSMVLQIGASLGMVEIPSSLMSGQIGLGTTLNTVLANSVMFQEQIALAAATTLTPFVQKAMAGTIALAIRDDLTVLVNRTVQESIALGISAVEAQQAGLVLFRSLSLGVALSMIELGALTSDPTQAILQFASDMLIGLSFTSQSLSAGLTFSNESLEEE